MWLLSSLAQAKHLRVSRGGKTAAITWVISSTRGEINRINPHELCNVAQTWARGDLCVQYQITLLTTSPVHSSPRSLFKFLPEM